MNARFPAKFGWAKIADVGGRRTEVPRVGAVLHPVGCTVESTVDVVTTLDLMVRSGAWWVLVTECHKVVGAVSARDIQVAMAHPSGRPVRVGDLCPQPVCPAQLDEPLDHLLTQMARIRATVAVVTNDVGLPIGVVAADDICTAFGFALRKGSTR